MKPCLMVTSLLGNTVFIRYSMKEPKCNGPLHQIS